MNRQKNEDGKIAPSTKGRCRRHPPQPSPHPRKVNADRRQLHRAGRPADALIEEAIALLRTAPGSLVSYFTGAIPFWLALLYFLSDMSHSADAEAHLAPASLGVALLFIWMKCWQTVFASRLRTVLLDETDVPWTAARITRMALHQTGPQTWSLPVRFVALLVGIPFAWVSSFCQNVSILGDGRSSATPDAPTVFQRSVAQARLWPGQMHKLILQLSLLGFFIWVNVIVLLIFVPSLLKTFFGIETIFSRSIGAFLNTTFFTATFALTMLCLDPLWRAVYVLCCFYGESLRTGRDLALRLRRVRHTALILALAALCGFGGIAAPLRAAEPAPIADTTELNRRIDEVLERREYTWRTPREKIPRTKGWFGEWIEKVGEMIRDWVKSVAKRLERLMKWIAEKWYGDPASLDGASKPWGAGTRLALWAALALSLAIIVWALLRALREKRAPVVAAEAITAVPDLTADDVAADELPEDGWLALARDHAARGDFALAMRAMWLACLAHLGHRELLRIARHKSNRDYDRELRRRARGNADLIDSFDRSLLTFERSWYGEHEVTREALGAFAQHLERIRAC